MRLLRRSRPRRAPQPVFISNSSGVTGNPLSDRFTDRHPANHSGPTDRVEIVIVRHERRPELEAGRGMHAILCAPCAEIGRASPDETVLYVVDLHRTEDGSGTGPNFREEIEKKFAVATSGDQESVDVHVDAHSQHVVFRASVYDMIA